MNQVRTIALDHWFDWFDLEDEDPAALVEGTPYTLEALRTPTGTLPWDDFAVLMRRFTGIVGGQRAVAEVTRTYTRQQGSGPVRTLVSTLGNPVQIYQAVHGFLGPAVFPCIESTVAHSTELELELELRIPDHLQDCPEWFWACKGALSEVSTLCGWPAARVKMHLEPRRACYTIRLQPPKEGWYDRLRRTLPRRTKLKRAAEAIARQQAELQGSYRALSRANLHMQHLAERERRLARVGRRLAEQVELAPLLDIVASICTDELGFPGISVSIHRPSSITVTRGSLGEDTVRHVLRRSERDLGELEVPAAPTAGVELLGRLIPWIALAIDNAIHFEAATANRRALQAQLDLQARTTAALEASEARWRGLVSSIPDIVLTIDRDYRITFVNRIRFGVPADRVVHMDIRAFSDDTQGFTQRLDRVFHEGITVHHDSQWTGPDGISRYLSYELGPIIRDGEVTSAVLVLRDETRRRKAELEHRDLERRVLEKQKLESLGVLAGGIAHDFNNLLMGITANAELAELHLPSSHPARPFVQRIETAGTRAGELTRQMLTYAGRRTVRPEQMDINVLVRDLGDLLQAALPKQVRLVWSLQADLPAVQADPAQLQQVVLNVLKNAADAIGEAAGTVTLRTGVEVLKEGMRGLHRQEPVAEGPYVVIEISDTGCGMTPDVQQRIFDPFYSTKATGRGLGLAAVLGIVRAHNGIVDVHSIPGQGTSFQVYFPAMPTMPAAPDPATREESPFRLMGRTVLVVDDEPVVRQVAADLLRHHGARVITARDGADALERFTAHPEIDVVLLDLTMPGSSGDEVFDEMRKVRSDARILLTSGYDARDAVSRLQARGLAGFLRKPWDGRSLVDVVARTASDEPVSALEASVEG